MGGGGKVGVVLRGDEERGGSVEGKEDALSEERGLERKRKRKKKGKETNGKE